MELQTKSNVSISKLFISNSLEVKEEFEEVSRMEQHKKMEPISLISLYFVEV